ncbi:heavy-metal-associated domain-containing protein [Myxococcota bacterium]|nr:heavy-metal-associated domain-containing protein [Myxococcota bacterium]
MATTTSAAAGQDAGEPTTLTVGGMTCQGCVRRVTDVISRGGADAVEVDLVRGEARFRASPALRADIRRALDADGWDVGA